MPQRAYLHERNERRKVLIIIDKNFGNPSLKQDIKEAALGWHPIFQWVFAPASNIADRNGHAVDNIENLYEHPMFVSSVGPGHPYRLKILSLFESFLTYHNLWYSEIIRIKLNIVPMAGPESTGKYQMPHVDSDSEHKVFLYYLNDSDGDTYFFNERFGDNPTSFTVQDTVTPEEGKAVLFDGNIYHAPSAPVKSPYRAVINIDFV